MEKLSDIKSKQATSETGRAEQYVNAGGNNKTDQKQVNVTYGHNGGGKSYTYLAPANTRAGQIVTPPVTNPKTGKTYNTLARVISTRDAKSSPAANTTISLANRGIMLKNIGKSAQAQLPGYYRGWGKDAKAQYDLANETRLKNSTGKLSSDQKRDINNLRWSGVKFKNEDTWDDAQRKRYSNYVDDDAPLNFKRGG